MPTGLTVTGKLGIIAGQGPLPGLIVAACRQSGREVFVVAVEGETDPAILEDIEHVWQPIGAVGATFKLLKSKGCRDVVMIGRIERPNFKELKPDLRGAMLIPKFIKAAGQGDDALLRVMVDEFERDGFRVLAAEDILTELNVDAGDLARQSPAPDDLEDIERARQLIATLGPFEVGQGVVVRGGQVLAVEAAEGTDAMLQRCAAFAEDKRGGVLVKMPKPAQDRRVDLPTVGLTTMQHAVEARLAGIAVEAGGILLVDRHAVIECADEHGLFLHAFARDTP